jgi:serine/threonine protein kinase
MMTTDLVGQVIGGYTLHEAIGAGSLAVVYKAYQPDLERWIAVKVLHYKEDVSLVRFRREAKAVAALRHRNILIVNEYGEEGDWPYQVMEYVQGGTLKDRLTGEPMDWPKAVKLIIPIADALSYAHSQNIIHRDIKPSNILMAREDWPLLADFGMIKVIDSDVALTRRGTVLGTPNYIAPEQARGGEIDYRVDIYGLGVILFQLVTGRLPFEHDNVNRILLAHLVDPPPSPRRFNPDCPMGLEQVILTAMKKAPEDRFDSMRALINALQEVLASSQERPTPHQAPVPGPVPGPVEEDFRTDALDPAKVDPPREVAEPAAVSSRRSTARLFLLDQRKTVHVPDLDQERFIIGRTHRDTKADIDLNPYGAADQGVSRQHACLIRQDAAWLIDDLDSLNGTFVNDVKVTPGQPAPLQDGDTVSCSHLSFLFLITPAGLID